MCICLSSFFPTYFFVLVNIKIDKFLLVTVLSKSSFYPLHYKSRSPELLTGSDSLNFLQQFLTEYMILIVIFVTAHINPVLRGHLSRSRALAEGAALGWPVPVLEADDS